MEKKNKRNIILSLSLMLVVTITLLGLTYAYYRTRVVENEAEKSIGVKIGKLEVKYINGNSLIIDEPIDVGFSDTKTFSVQNTGDAPTQFSIKFENVVNTFQRKRDWTYTLVRDGNIIIENEVIPSKDSYLNIDPLDLIIGDGVTSNFELTINYKNLENEDQSVDMGKTLSFKVNIDGEYAVVPEDTIFANAAKDSLLYAIGIENEVVTPPTKPGEVQSGQDEAIFASTEDDYGTSYYYRGNVENNYINYSGMCWRIVRVLGNGKIKLILADENNECDAPGYSVNNKTSGYLGGRTDIAYKVSSTSTTADARDVVFEMSDIPEILSNWVTSKSLDTTKLDTTEWCNDTTIYKATEAAKSYYYFGPYDRNTVGTPNAPQLPSLKCDFNGNYSFDDFFGTVPYKYTSNIGILTIDEVAFAGGTNSSDLSIGNYLTTNANADDTFSWTMSPFSYKTTTTDSGTTYLSRVHVLYRGHIKAEAPVGVDIYDGSLGTPLGSVRPSVILKADVKLLSGAGSQESPYEV